jgi:hypothetical protein
MAYIFGDGFDCYATTADPFLGYWDSGAASNATLIAGRFAGGQAWNFSTSAGVYFVKSSGQNDAAHHIVMAFRQTFVLSGTTLGLYFQLSDAATNQVCIVFRSDGAILLTSATPAGTVLDTYTGAVSAANTWFSFEFEIVINATTGSWSVRKNGNTSNDRFLGSLNTRPGTNAYANKLTVGIQVATNAQQIDDLLWRSDASSVPFVGDIRAYTRMPASDASTQFARAPSPVSVAQSGTSSGTTSKAANLGIMSAFTAAYSGTIASCQVSINAGATGNMKAAIYDSTRTIVLATSNAVVNPASGSNAITFGTPLTVTKGTVYHLAVDQDATIVYNTTGFTQWSFTTTYASFPAAGPALTANQTGPLFTVNITPTINAEFVSETLQDGTTSYVYDSTPGDADFYNIGTIASTPLATVAVTTRGFMQKSDAGTRTAAVQIKSGGTTVASPTATLSSNFGWVWRTDSTDPATGTAWSATGVNNATIGPRTVA